MCDATPVINWLQALIAAIVGTLALLGVAVAYNGSILGAWMAPAWMLGAAGATAFAILLCGRALSALDTVCACLKPRCAGDCRNVRAAINAIRTVLSIQATACLAAALTAWIPWFGQSSIYAIGGALISQVPLVISAIVLVGRLQRCADVTPGEFGGAGGGIVQ